MAIPCDLLLKGKSPRRINILSCYQSLTIYHELIPWLISSGSLLQKDTGSLLRKGMIRGTSGLINFTVLPASEAAGMQQGLQTCQVYTSVPGTLWEQELEGGIHEGRNQKM